VDARTGVDADELAIQCGEAMSVGDDAARKLGIRLKVIGPGHAVMDMEIKPWMANGDDVCHGGLLFTLADTAMAFASNSRDECYVAVSASMEFLSPGRLGETVTAVAVEQHRAGRTATYSVTVTDSGGDPVAQLLGRTYRVRGTVIERPENAP
jgi:acyl-CoA thioesterase